MRQNVVELGIAAADVRKPPGADAQEPRLVAESTWEAPQGLLLCDRSRLGTQISKAGFRPHPPAQSGGTVWGRARQRFLLIPGNEIALSCQDACMRDQ
jgi:hypothetical protein